MKIGTLTLDTRLIVSTLILSLTLAFFTLPQSASAQTAGTLSRAGLIALITQLQARIAELQKQIATTPEGGFAVKNFEVGDSVVATDVLKVRETYGSTGKLLGIQKAGSYGKIVAGPQSANSYRWWKIDYTNTPDGWSAENWLNEAPPVVDPTVIDAEITSISISENPLVSGKAYGTDTVGLVVSDGGKVYGSGNIEVENNSWQHKVTTDLPVGKYDLILYVNNVEYDRKSFSVGEVDDDDIKAEIISVSNSENPVVKGEAEGVEYVSLSVAYESGDKAYGSGPIKVTNNAWEHKIATDLTDGEYKLSLYAHEGGTKQLYDTVAFVVDTDGPENVLIQVTSPNGGESWEIGQLNTIKWTPYDPNNGVNHSSDVNVYLERTDGSTVGMIMDTGKASLHTYFNINNYSEWAKAGSYYVRAKNRITGVSDRSDKPFTLLPRAIDIKVNGSDGPVTLYDNQPVTITFTLGTAFTSCLLNGVRETVNGGAGVEFGNKYPIGETFKGYAYAPNSDSSVAIYVTCSKSDGSKRSDSVMVNVSDSSPYAIVTVESPNGGEKFDPNKEMTVQFSSSGIKSASMALYKNDQFKYWINKDVQPSAKDLGSVSFFWIPSKALTGLGEGDNAGAIFKIYLTAQKADGTGYVDDKSDAPFSFVTSTEPTPTYSQAYYQGTYTTTPTYTQSSYYSQSYYGTCWELSCGGYIRGASTTNFQELFKQILSRLKVLQIGED